MLKTLTALVTLLILWEMAGIWRVGKKLAAGERGAAVSRHRSLVFRTAALMLLAVALIEFQVQTAPARGPKDLLLGFHFGTVGALLLAFAGALGFSGLRSPRWHRPLVYTVFAFFSLAVLSGTALLYRLPH